MIETANLSLRPYTPQQLLALIEAPDKFGDLVGFAPADGLRDFFVGDEISKDFVAHLRSGIDADPWNYGFAVVHRQARRVIGGGSFKGPPDPDGIVEIAYAIVPEFEGSGFATEVSRALIEYAARFDEVRLIRAHTLPVANASTRVLTKCGFDHVGAVVDPEDGDVWRWELQPLRG